LAFDHQKPKEYRKRKLVKTDDMCTMCGEFCALRLVRNDF
ncbi:MAG: phosphomethylpyrimidine synthase ThiC, partial [Methanobacteriaceae archaeon]|nr:phosphomethylpyrimidine synthase ThiC [Methanobacteriaceae archaeon]